MSDERSAKQIAEERELREEEETAAAEAARIGGRAGDEDLGEAERAPAEGGGGEAEGFEQSEELLIEQASHESRPTDPMNDAAEPEEERDGAAHGEADSEAPPD